MSPRLTAVLDRLRRPEYTGDNRCLPCTIVNVVLAAVASALVARLTSGSRSGGRSLGALTFAASLLAIYLRGYLVPGTPTLTKRYLPDAVHGAFGEDPPGPRTGIEIADTGESLTAADAAAGAANANETETKTEPETASDDTTAIDDDGDERDDSDAEDGTGDALSNAVEEIERQREQAVDPEQFLLEVDAVEPCEDADDLCLTDEFADRVADALETHRDTTVDETAVAGMGAIDPAAVTDADRDYPAFKIGRRIHKWPDEAALLADLAVHHALTDQSDRWADVPSGQRLALLEVMRSFLDACPDCGGPIGLTDDTVESCCGAYEVLAMECADCGAALLEFDPTAVGGSGGIEP